MDNEDMKIALGIVKLDTLNIEQRANNILDKMCNTQKKCAEAMLESLGNETSLLSNLIYWIAENESDCEWNSRTESYMNDAHDLIYGSYNFDEHVCYANSMCSAWDIIDEVNSHPMQWSKEIMMVWVLNDLVHNFDVEECSVEQMGKIYEKVTDYIKQFNEPHELWDNPTLLMLPSNINDELFGM